MFKKYEQTALSNLDSYKLGHADQYPDGIDKVYSNFTPRSEYHFNVPAEYKTGNIVWVGLQLLLIEMKGIWQTTFFDLEWETIKDEVEELYAPFCGPRGFDVSRLKALHDLGYLPLEIKSLPEGSLVPIGVPVLTVTNTHKAFAWLPNFLETWLSAELWKCPTSATTSYVYKKILNKYAALTGGSKEFIQWQGHDFSVRGMSGIIDAAKSGFGHITSFSGTDNIPAVKLARDSYGGKKTFIGGSVPATEHSVMCAGGKESELETFRRLLTTYPSGVVSIVSDTWDFWNVVGDDTCLAAQLKEEILNRVPDQFGLAKTVFRPDSGDPVKIICGYKSITRAKLLECEWEAYDDGVEVVEFEDGTFFELIPVFDKYDGCFDDFNYGDEMSRSEVKGAIECLWDIFGGTTNELGYRTLNQRVGLIYGDSITPQRCESILQILAEKGFASDNVVFGIGSYTFQYQTRDTFGFAMKATYVEIDGVGQAIFKDPKTDSGTKKSAKGLLCVSADETGKYVLLNDVCEEVEASSLMQTVFLNGEITKFQTIEEIRNRLASYE